MKRTGGCHVPARRMFDTPVLNETGSAVQQYILTPTRTQY
jgi:hypothetical protein